MRPPAKISKLIRKVARLEWQEFFGSNLGKHMGLLVFSLLSQKLEAYFFVSVHKDLLEHSVPYISKLPLFSSHGPIFEKFRSGGGLPDILRVGIIAY
jgi:hypothetical protein